MRRCPIRWRDRATRKPTVHGSILRNSAGVSGRPPERNHEWTAAPVPPDPRRLMTSSVSSATSSTRWPRMPADAVCRALAKRTVESMSISHEVLDDALGLGTGGLAGVGPAAAPRPDLCSVAGSPTTRRPRWTGWKLPSSAIPVVTQLLRVGSLTNRYRRRDSSPPDHEQPPNRVTNRFLRGASDRAGFNPHGICDAAAPAAPQAETRGLPMMRRSPTLLARGGAV